MHEQKKLHVAVLLGGTSSEREVSLKSGRAVANNLDPKAYRVTVYDPAVDLPKIVQNADQIDVALIMLHGGAGEDGSMQGFLEMLGIPYQSAGVLGCALAMDKPKAKTVFKAAGLPVADDVLLLQGGEQGAAIVLKHLTLPVVVKPAREGSSFGISIVQDQGDLKKALDKAFELDKEVLVEEFLDGRELTCAVIGNTEPKALPIIEIRPTEKYDFFDYDAKYLPGASQEICPAPVDEKTTLMVQDLAVRAHQALGLSGYSRSDFIFTGKGPILLETNTVPGMTETSLLPQSAQAAGMEFPLLLDRLIRLALEKAGKEIDS